MYRYFKKICDTDHISLWKSKGLSVEGIMPPALSNNTLPPALNYAGNKTRVKFYGNILKHDKITINHGKIVKVYIFYELNVWNRGYDDYPVLENYLFGAARVTKNADIDEY